MIEPRAPRYEWGQRVRALGPVQRRILSRDRRDALLVNTGDTGEIVNVGTHVESNTPVYMVEFPANRVVGCLEEEIAPAEREDDGVTPKHGDRRIAGGKRV